MSFTRNKITAVLGAAVAIGGVGAGVALGTSGSSSSAATPVVAPVAAPAALDTTETTAPETGAAETGGPDTDNVREGDQTTPDGPNEKADPAESGTEKASAAEPAGGHEDPPGAEVDHQYDGVE